MIARIWHGWTPPDNAPAYQALLVSTVLPGIAAKGITGYRGAHVLRRAHEDEVEFVTLLWFDSLEDVRALAGEEYETAYVPSQARVVLARFDARSQHYEVVLVPDGDAA